MSILKMTYNEREQLLIDYAEGTLSADQKLNVENMLRDSKELRNEYQLIQTSFQELQKLPVESVPEHYFNNFLPRLRNKIEAKERYSHWLVPQWMESLFVPGVTLLLLFTFGTLYLFLEPSRTQSPLYKIVQDIEQNEFDNIIEEVSNLELSYGSIRTGEQLVDRISHTDEITQKISTELLSVDLFASQMDSDWIELLEESEIDFVLNQLNETGIQ